MPELKLVISMCIIALVFALSAGCTGSEINHDMPVTTGTQSETPDSAQTGQISEGSTGEYSIQDSLPAEIGIEVSASPVSNSAVLIKYNLDLSSMGTAMGHEGWEVLATVYAYNPEKVGTGFSVNSYNDIISGGIPYKTNNIRIYPSNKYPGKAEVSINADSKMTIDTGEYYIYGVVLREA